MSSAVEIIRRWRLNPILFARECLGVEPDLWQADALKLLPSNGGLSRVALKACAGPGKSALLAWAGWWFLLTQGEPGEHPKGAAVSITADNLRDNLWAELSKWQQRSRLLSEVFTWQRERIFANDHPTTWFMSARSFARSASAEDQANTLSGLHAKRVFILVDESGDMMPAIGQKIEQALSNCACGLAIQAGNPTKLTGLLATSVQQGWQTITITADPDDPKRTPRVSLEWARAQIKLHGRDNPWVMALILGKFPPGGINALMGLEDVQTAFNRSYLEGDFQQASKVIGVDVARFGDDATVILRRQGVMSWQGIEMRGADGTQIGDRVAYEINEWHPDAVLIDGTGGWGASAIDRLRVLGHRNIIDVQFAGKPDSDKFANLRAEMWWNMAQWVKKSGQLATHAQMQADLIGPTYGFSDTTGRMLIESKEDMKKRGVPSPNFGDALAITFARKVMPQALMDALDIRQQQSRKRFDPLGRVSGYR